MEFEAGLGGTIYSVVEHVFFADISFTPYISAWDNVYFLYFLILLSNQYLFLKIDFYPYFDFQESQ